MRRMLRCWKDRALQVEGWFYSRLRFWVLVYLCKVSKASWFFMNNEHWRSRTYAYLLAVHGAWLASKFEQMSFQPDPELWRM